MVRLIMGANGAGKTKKLIELINASAAEENGNVVCIEAKSTMTFDIHYHVRLISADEYQIAVLAPVPQVARQIHPAFPERVRDEFLICQFRIVQIPLSDAQTGNTDLSRRPDGDGKKRLVQNEDLRIVHRPPDRHRIALFADAVVICYVYGAFGRSVQIV